MDTAAPSNVSTDQQSVLAAAAHVLQSPSLPNLIQGQLHVDMTALLAEAQFSPYFSMPSLSKNSLMGPGCSAWGTGAVDSVAALSGNLLPILLLLDAEGVP